MKLVWNTSKNRVFLRDSRFSITNFVRILRVLTLKYLLKHHSQRNNSGNTSLNVIYFMQVKKSLIVFLFSKP